MRSFVRPAGLIIIALLTGACVTTTSTTMRSWVDKPIDEVVSRWGAPTSSMPLDDGGKVLTWVTVSGSDGASPLAANLSRRTPKALFAGGRTVVVHPFRSGSGEYT